MKRLAVFASGNGSNFEAIAGYRNKAYETVLLIADHQDAYAIKRAERLGIPYFAFEVKNYPDKAAYEEEILKMLLKHQVDFIALAGYMRLVGPTLLNHYSDKIINIHPSLLPSFSGLDAIGQAFRHGVLVTGITIHYADAGMDTGRIIAQKAVSVRDTLEATERAIHRAEHQLYKRTIEKLLSEESYEKSINQRLG